MPNERYFKNQTIPNPYWIPASYQIVGEGSVGSQLSDAKYFIVRNHLGHELRYGKTEFDQRGGDTRPKRESL